jgi:nucleoside-diphosphate-sugar epimerase
MANLLTGLTGGLGTAIGEKLNKYEQLYCLVRGGRERLNGEILLRGLPSSQIIKGDVTEKDCGITEDDLIFLQNKKINKIVHCAASVKFDEKLTEATWLTNYQGTLNVIELAKELHVEQVWYVSTAYSSTRRNPYEKSKAQAEIALIQSGIKYAIIAPSVIIGDSVTGKTTAFDGMYGYFGGFYKLSKLLEKERRNGIINLPIHIDCSMSSTINLVPMDWVADMLVKLVKKGDWGEKYYLTHKNPPLVNEIMAFGIRHFGIDGFTIREPGQPLPELEDELLKYIQEEIRKRVGTYKQYVTEEQIVMNDAVRVSLGSEFVEPPEITREMIGKMLDYAATVNFGKKNKETDNGTKKA